jgi:hypothetical protein
MLHFLYSSLLEPITLALQFRYKNPYSNELEMR